VTFCSYLEALTTVGTSICISDSSDKSVKLVEAAVALGGALVPAAGLVAAELSTTVELVAAAFERSGNAANKNRRKKMILHAEK
jgi:hypothetical protein